jgi:hypothetical protein
MPFDRLRANELIYGESQLKKNLDDFVGLEDGRIPHASSDCDVLNPYELGFQLGFAVFQEHGNDLLQVAAEFVKCFSLGMSTRKAGDKPDEQS